MLGLSALALASFGLTSCQDDFDAPAIQVPEAANEANVTIMQLKEAFWQDAYNYAETVGDLSEITGDEADGVMQQLIHVLVNFMQKLHIIIHLTVNILSLHGLKIVENLLWY